MPQKFINSQIPKLWECYALNLTTQGQFIDVSEEGLAFADRDFRGEFENSGANAKPLQVVYGDEIIYGSTPNVAKRSRNFCASSSASLARSSADSAR